MKGNGTASPGILPFQLLPVINIDYQQQQHMHIQLQQELSAPAEVLKLIDI